MQALKQYQAIKNGMELLDENRPGWMELIELDRLDIHSDLYCVLGQVYGSYCDALDVLHLSFESEKYGFFEEKGAPRRMLTERWKRYIALRRRSRE